MTDKGKGEVGYILKRQRINLGLKQVSVAKGICSISYLSKVENGKLEPNEEILVMLLRRLNLNSDVISNCNEEDFMSKIENLHMNAVLYREREKVEQELQEISEPEFLNISNFIDYHLYLLRLGLIIQKNPIELSEIIQILKGYEKNLTSKQAFIYNLNIGLYHYRLGESSKALFIFEGLLKKLEIERVSLNKWEEADFYNILSASYLKNRDHVSAIRYSGKAISFYKDNHLFDRIIDCYIISGIAYKNLCDFTNAKKNYYLAKKLAESVNIEQYNGMIQHNLGSLYSAEGRHDEALECLVESYRTKVGIKQYSSLMPTILKLIVENAKLNNESEVVKWCRVGINIIEEQNASKTFSSYLYHFHLYRIRYEKSTSSNLEEVIKDTIKYFESIGDDRYVQKYSLILAEYYRDINKYKLSGLYYKKANKVLLKQKLVNSLEDL